MLATIFILLLILAIFEMGQVFTSYLVITSSVREGAIYASKFNDAGDVDMAEYRARIRRGLDKRGVDSSQLTIHDPQFDTPTSDNITVKVDYKLSTLFSSSISLPYFGRMGLPSTYAMSYDMIVQERTW